MPENDLEKKNQLAALGLTAPVEQPKKLEAQKDSKDNKYGSAGILAAGSLLGGLMAQKAQQEAQQRSLASQIEKMKAEEESKSLSSSQQAQQDAFTRLMSSYRSALT